MKIVAIGGGDKDKAVNHALELSGDENPSVLLVPTAASTQASYDRKVPMLKDYFKSLGVKDINTLHEFGETPTKTRINHELGRASLIYTIGGNSPYMIKTMREHGTDQAIAHAISRGMVHAGTSAGALLPFELAHSNIAARPAEVEWDYQYLDMIGAVPGVATAHANQYDPTPNGPRSITRQEDLVNRFPTGIDTGYAIDNGAALVFNGTDAPKTIRSTPDSNAHILQRNPDDTISVDVIK